MNNVTKKKNRRKELIWDYELILEIFCQKKQNNNDDDHNRNNNSNTLIHTKWKENIVSWNMLESDLNDLKKYFFNCKHLKIIKEIIVDYHFGNYSGNKRNDKECFSHFGHNWVMLFDCVWILQLARRYLCLLIVIMLNCQSYIKDVSARTNCAIDDCVITGGTLTKSVEQQMN